MDPVDGGDSVALSQVVPPFDTSLVVAEYTALREEVLKRVELNHQVLSVMMFALGTLLAVGVQFHTAAAVLVYPLLAMFLSGVWAYNERRAQRIRAYIRDRIEVRVGSANMGWEHTLARSYIGHTRFAFGWMACFLGVECIAIAVGWSIAQLGSPLDVVAGMPTTVNGQQTGVLMTLLTLDAFSVLVTVILLRPRSDIQTPSLDLSAVTPTLETATSAAGSTHAGPIRASALKVTDGQ